MALAARRAGHKISTAGTAVAVRASRPGFVALSASETARFRPGTARGGWSRSGRQFTGRVGCKAGLGGGPSVAGGSAPSASGHPHPVLGYLACSA